MDNGISMKLTAEDISKIPGFGPIKAGNFVSGWKMMRPEIENILKPGVYSLIFFLRSNIEN